MVARALGADRVIVAYFSLENLSPTTSHNVDDEIGRFTSEWHFSAAHLAPLLDTEAGRIRRLLAAGQAKRRPQRTIVDPRYPAGMVVTDPYGGRGRKKGAWQLYDGGMIADSGECWECGYCKFRTLCNDHGDDSSDTTDVSDLLALANTTEDASPFELAVDEHLEADYEDRFSPGGW